MNLSIAEYKRHAEMLGRFANIREGAPEPTDRILVQCEGMLKFVAGDEVSTLIVSTGVPCDGERGKALIPARLFLSAAKTLRGKGDISLSLDGKGGAILKTNTGGKVVLPRVSDTIPSWVRPSDTFATALSIGVPARFWPDFSKLVALGPHKHGWPADHVHLEAEDGELFFVWADNYRWVRASVAAVSFADYRYLGSIPADFVKSLKAFEGETALVVQGDRLSVQAGESSALALLYHATRNGKRETQLQYPPQVKAHEWNVDFSVSRKDLIDNIKAVSTADQYGRVTLMVSAGHVKVYGYHAEGEGSMTMDTDTTGHGHVSFNAELATKLLSGLSSKSIRVLFPSAGAGLIQFKEDKWGWQMFLAPIAL